MTAALQDAQKQESKYPLNPEEAVWVSQAQQGNRKAFTKIVEAYQRPVYNVCYRMLGNAVEAEDAAQEVFVRAFFKLDTYDSGRKFSSWLFSIASHYAIDQLRKRRMQVISWDDLPPWRWLPDENSPQPEEYLLKDEATQEVHALLDTLPADYRAAVILKYWHNMPYEEIAQTLSTTVSAIKSKLFRARKMLAQAAEKRSMQ